MRQDETGAVRLRFFNDHWEAKPFLGARNFAQHQPMNLGSLAVEMFFEGGLRLA